MTTTRTRTLRHVAGSTILVSLLTVAGNVWSAPPTAMSTATTSTGASYQACLRAALGASGGAAVGRAMAEAAVACGSQEAALSAAVLKENPDRPLFARSYAQTLKDEVEAQRVPGSAWRGLSTFVALRTRP